MKKIPETVATDGIRNRFRRAMDPKRFDFPRKRLNHEIKWYLDGTEILRRPTMGLYAMAMFAEYMLHQTRFGRLGQKAEIHLAAEFFAETRRAMQNTLSTYDIHKRLTPKNLASLRKVVGRLLLSARKVYEAVGVASRGCDCPACRGKRMDIDDARLLEAILLEQSRNGTIRKDSKLFRNTPLTPYAVI